MTLLESEAAIDVTIEPGQVICESDASRNLSWSYTDKANVCLRAKDVGNILVRDGRQIIFDAVEGTDEQRLKVLILGPALGVLLYQRDCLVLHGSAVSVGEGAVAFLGESGQGKSTTAAAMRASGYHVITDDVLAIDLSRLDVPSVLPGFPQLKLWPEAIAFLGEAPEALPRVYSGVDKRARRIEEEFAASPQPLRCLYVLADGQSVEVKRLAPQDALIELVRNSYVRRLVHSARDSTQMFKCAAVARQLPVCKLHRPRSLAALSELVKALEADAAGYEL